MASRLPGTLYEKGGGPVVEVTIHKGKYTERRTAVEGQNLLEFMQETGYSVPAACGGRHTCGKCKVCVTGDLSDKDREESKFLKGLDADVRLACFAKIQGPCTLWLPEADTNQIETSFIGSGEKTDPVYEGYGVAFDIGTTTVVGYLFEDSHPEPLAVCGEMNNQLPYGADVLSRIVYCNEHTVKPLQRLLRDQLSRIATELCCESEVQQEAVQCMVITGNTTMLHILAGMDPGPLAIVPFVPRSLFGSWHNLKLKGFEKAKAYLPGCMSAYVGADITCSILAGNLKDRPGNILLVDAGTNGEMVLKTNDRLVCCSTAAGPAFEGAGITCGSSAVEGAIDTVYFNGNGLSYTTIGGKPAKSLCGSGLIDGAAAMLNGKIMDKKGLIHANPERTAFIGETEVFINQQDIRQLQLAKAAVRAGMDTLMDTCGLDYSSLDQIVLCGGFGSCMNPMSAGRIGMIPWEMRYRTEAIGNGAGKGAGAILQNRGQLEYSVQIVKEAETVELSMSSYFMKRYVKMMDFHEVME